MYYLKMSSDGFQLPIAMNRTSEQAEIDIILRQLFSLKQDTELIRKILVEDKDGNVSQVSSMIQMTA